MNNFITNTLAIAYCSLFCLSSNAYAHDNWVYAIAKAKPSMVKISSHTSSKNTSSKKEIERNQALGEYADFFKEDVQKTTPMKHGSGFIIHTNNQQSLLLTALHVVSKSKKVWIQTQNGKKFRAEILHSNYKHDVAVLSINKGNLPTLDFNRAPLNEGQAILGIGSAFGLSTSSSAGIISALNVKLSKSSVKTIQTDVSINPGSSGGALVDIDGNVIGLITKIYSDTGTFSGSSFATPIRKIEKLLDKWEVPFN